MELTSKFKETAIDLVHTAGFANLELPTKELWHNSPINYGFSKIPVAEQIIESSGANIHYQMPQALYDYMGDWIALPSRNQFKEERHFYNVAFHELSHWTGARHRLAREPSRPGFRFNRQTRAHEELVAEFSSAYVCRLLGIDTHKVNAIYIKIYANRVDPSIVAKAAKDAAHAAEYILEKAK